MTGQDGKGHYAVRLFVVCFDSNSIFIYDPADLRSPSATPAPEKIIYTGRGPYALAFDPFSPQDVATNARGASRRPAARLWRSSGTASPTWRASPLVRAGHRPRRQQPERRRRSRTSSSRWASRRRRRANDDVSNAAVRSDGHGRPPSGASCKRIRRSSHLRCRWGEGSRTRRTGKECRAAGAAAWFLYWPATAARQEEIRDTRRSPETHRTQRTLGKGCTST